MKFKIIYVFIFFLSFSTYLGAQSNNIFDSNSSQKEILYNKEKAFKIRLQTNGLAMSWYTAKIRTYYKTNFVHYELGYLKNSRELSQRFDFTNPFTSQAARSFVFGKQNSLYVARVGIGQKYYYSDKARRRGIAIASTYEFGGVLGLQKPYYLELLRFKDNGSSAYISTEKFSEENKDLFTDINRIFGGASFFKAWNEITPVPGIFGRAGLLFEWDTSDGYFTGMEAGLQVDAFPKKVPIMINQPNQLLFINLYITIELGKRK